MTNLLCIDCRVFRFPAFVSTLAAAAVLSACGGVTSVLTPRSPVPRPSGSAAATTGLFAGATPVAVGALSSPVPLPTPSSGSYTIADLATQLDASNPPPPGSPVGTVGLVTAIGANSIVVVQIPMLPPNDANGNPIPLVQNLPLVGSFAAPVTVSVDQKTVFSNAGGLSGISVGTTIFAGGTASGSTLQASVVGALSVPAQAAPKSGARAYTVPVSSIRSRASLGADVRDALTTQISNLGPALNYHGKAFEFTSGALPCRDLLGRSTGGSGTWKATLATQAIFSLGNLNANFPFTITYDPKPPQFTQNNGAFSGPGPVPDWLNFVALTGTDSMPTVFLTAGADLGFSLKIGTTCPGNLPPFELASASVGYAIESVTTKPMPGPRQSVTLDAKTCPGLNGPVNINLFVDPKSGLPDINPFGSQDTSTSNLNFCDQPTINGNLVTASVGSVTGATVNNPDATFDPSQSGRPSVLGFGDFTPNASPITFNLRNFMYHPGYVDGYKLQFTIASIPVLESPAVSPFPVIFGGLRASDVPVSISAQQLSQLCETVTSGNAFLGLGSSCNAHGAVDFQFCKPSGGFTCASDSSGTSGTVQVTESGYTGPFTIMDGDAANPFSGGCEGSMAQTYAISVSPRTATGPTATFTVAAGAQQLHRDDTGCSIYILDASGHYVSIALQLITYT